MQIEQRFDLPQSPAAAWPAFADVELLVECLPGASLTGPAVDGDLPLRFDVKLGPIAAGFVGSGRVLLDDAARAGRFEGQAVDKRSHSRVKGVAAFSLQAEGEGTRVAINVDYNLSGTLAQFSRGGIVRELASALTAQFAANLAARLQLATEAAAATEIARSESAPVQAEQGEAAQADADHTGTPREAAPVQAEQGRALAARPASGAIFEGRGANAVAAGPSSSPSPSPGPIPGSARPASNPATAVPLSAWSLIKQVIVTRWRRLVSRRQAPLR